MASVRTALPRTSVAVARTTYWPPASTGSEIRAIRPSPGETVWIPSGSSTNSLRQRSRPSAPTSRTEFHC